MFLCFVTMEFRSVHIGGIILLNLCTIFLQGFIEEADDDPWGKLMVASMRDSDLKEKRGMTYMGLLSNCSEEEAESIKGYFYESCSLIKSLPDDTKYHTDYCRKRLG